MEVLAGDTNMIADLVNKKKKKNSNLNPFNSCIMFREKMNADSSLISQKSIGTRDYKQSIED